MSVENRICNGTLPHAFLEPACLENPRQISCAFRCHTGYRESDVIDLMFRTIFPNIQKKVLCYEGVWITHITGRGFGFLDICLPEGRVFIVS